MKQSTFDAGRVSALTDGIFAIAMTLLVLDLKLPDLATSLEGGAFAAALLEQWPKFLSWLLSFTILCRLWITQHALLAEGGVRSREFVGWTFLFLGAVSFTPFSTSLLSGHHDQSLAVIMFSASLAVDGIALVGMWRAEERRRGARIVDHTAIREMILLLATAAFSILVAFFSPLLGSLVWVAFALVAPFAGRQALRPHAKS